MKTAHRKYLYSAVNMPQLADRSVDLVVTSPPYPMIEMWDECFTRQDARIARVLGRYEGWKAFSLMHGVLDGVWDEMERVLKPGGFVCINIGDAVRKMGDDFGLFTNHARVVSAMVKRGMTPLPCILWRKQTNAPNKFMGSGMLPAGAYVTLEHEYILIFRKGGKRTFETAGGRRVRRESAIFWEERNHWYSDIWYDLKGVRQRLADDSIRKRSAAFPFEVPYRLINMYSVAGDRVLDPFSGIGTTMFAAMASGRSTVTFEIEAAFEPVLPAEAGRKEDIKSFSNRWIQSRIDRHRLFVEERARSGKPIRHINRNYGFPVVTRQETDLFLHPIAEARTEGNGDIAIEYAELPFREVEKDCPVPGRDCEMPASAPSAGVKSPNNKVRQPSNLFE